LHKSNEEEEEDEEDEEEEEEEMYRGLTTQRHGNYVVGLLRHTA
jgi:hypothetical protein